MINKLFILDCNKKQYFFVFNMRISIKITVNFIVLLYIKIFKIILLNILFIKQILYDKYLVDKWPIYLSEDIMHWNDAIIAQKHIITDKGENKIVLQHKWVPEHEPVIFINKILNNILYYIIYYKRHL